MAVESFLAHFTLTAEEAEALQSRDMQIDKRFFRTMQKAEQIIADSRVLMCGEDGPTKAGYVSISSLIVPSQSKLWALKSRDHCGYFTTTRRGLR